MSAPARPRRWFRRTLLTGLAVAGGVALLLAWLLHSDSGRDFSLARLQAALPPGALSWQRVEGRVGGPLVLHGLRYDDGGAVVTADRVLLDPDWLPALGRRLRFERLEADALAVTLPASDAPFSPPTWPGSLPRIPLPFDLEAQALAIDGFTLRRASMPPADDATGLAGAAGHRRLEGDGEADATVLFAATRIAGERVVLEHEGLTLGALRLDATFGQAELAGDYHPARNFHADLRGTLRLPVEAVPGVPADAPADVAADAAADADATPAGADAGPVDGATLRLTARGDLDELALDLAGRTPERLTLSLRLREGRGIPTWTLDALSEGLPPAWLGDAADAPAWRGRLQAEGRGGEAAVEGELARGEWRLGIAPSQVGLVDDRLLLRPLNLVLPEGPVRATGQVQYGGDAPAFDLQLASEALRLQPQGDAPDALPVDVRGAFRLRGVPDDWLLVGDATLARDGEEATLRLAGRGDTTALQLESLRADMPTGTLAGRGRVAWSPALALVLDARLDGFDPGYFLPDYPGAVRGDLDLDAAQDRDGTWRAEATLGGLGGQLRRRALGGDVALRWQGEAGEVDADLRVGASALRAEGAFGARYDLAVEASPLDLADLFADAAGRVDGRVQLRGAPEALDVAGALRADGLAWQGWRAETLQLDGGLPVRGDGALRLQGRGLSLDGTALDALAIDLSGNQSRARVQAEAAWPGGRAIAGGQVSREGGRVSGELATLQLAIEGQPTLRLQSPADFAAGAGGLRLARSCLVADGIEGRLCASLDANDATLEAEALPLALLQPWLPRDEGVPMHLTGRLDGQARLQRGRDGRWRGGGRFDSPLGALRLDEQAERVIFGYRELGLDWRFDGEWLEATLSALLANEGRIDASLRTGLADAAPLTGELVLDVRELTWLELFSEDLAAPAGRLQGRLGLAGTRAAPEFAGQARLADFSAEMPALGLRLREGEFLLTGQPDGTTRLEGSLRSGEGRLRFDGSLNFRQPDAPLQLVLRGQRVTLASTAEFFAIADPDLVLRLADGTLQVRGRVDVGEARFDLEALDTEVPASDDVVVVDPLDPPRERALPLDLDFTLALGEDVRLKGFGLDGRVGGTLALRQRPGRAARASGGLDVGGRYRAYGQSLEITRARLGYADSPVDDPSLDLRAERAFDDVTVGVQVRGTARRPETTITSNPAMDTSEALSWLVFGRPLRSASGSEAEQLDAAAMALGAGGNLVAQQLGARLGLDEAGISDSRNLGGATFTVGKYLSPRLFISYGIALVGTGQVVTLKYLLTRGFDIRVESGNESAASLNWRTER